MIILASARGVLEPHQVTGPSWNPSDKSSNVVLSNGNLTVTVSTSSNGGVRGTIGRSTGKFYWEHRLDAGPSGSSPFMGIKTTTGSLTSIGPFGSLTDYGEFSASPNTGHQDYQPNSTLGSIVGPALALGDVFIYAVDLGAGKMWIGRNGTWDNSGNPAAGTNQRISGISGTYYPWVTIGATAVTVTAHFSAGSWTYAAPTGFAAWA